MTRWFCSDHHISHANIIRFASRPFKNVIEMDEELLTYHNAFVKPEDHVTFLGDVTLRRGGKQDRDWFIGEMWKYNGHKRLHLGNHDHYPMKTYIEAGFEKIYSTWRDEQGLLFSHFPLHPTSLGTAIANVHGHIHQNPGPPPVLYLDRKTEQVGCKPYVNVCVEVTNYRPICYDELMARVRKGIEDGTNGDPRPEELVPPGEQASPREDARG